VKKHLPAHEVIDDCVTRDTDVVSDR